MRHLRTAVAALAIVSSLAAAAAQAQDQSDQSENREESEEKSPPAGSDEIIVTAQKAGVQSLQQVPLAIQAFSGETLKERNITTIGDLVSSVPGAQEGFRQSNASRFYNLRGNVTQNGDSPIGYYLDDTPFIVTNFGIAPPVRFIDMERVEVLRGPQGTLYGQGSSGGVFIFHTRDPDLNNIEYAFEAEASKTTGADELNYGAAAALSIPIVEDRFAIRASGGFSRDAGYADAYFGPYDGTPDQTNVNSARNDDIRVVALLRPWDNVDIRAQYWNFRPRQDFTGFTASVKPPYFENTAGQDGFSNGDFTLWSLTATAHFDAFTVTSATSHLEGEFGINIPLSPSGSFSSQFLPKMFAQELRVNSAGSGPFNWVVGAAYQDGEGPQENALVLPVVTINADNNTLTENWAVFGEISYELFDGKLVPLVGLRTYHDDRAFEDGTGKVPTKESVETWRLNLSYLPSDDLTMFISAATGFRPGIVQSRVQVESLGIAGVPAQVALDPESSTNYEFGLKWRNPDRSLNVGLNLYHLQYTNLQTSVTGGIDGVDGFANFGDATTMGIDLEVRWNTPIEGLNLGFVGNINDSEYDTVNEVVADAQPLLYPGARLLNTLANNFRLDANYNWEIASGFDGFSNISLSHSGDRLQANGLVADPYDLISLTLGVRRGPWELALIGNNLTDERGPTFLGTTGPLSGSGPTPRTIGLRLRMNSY
ncbi:outer membrane receptor protein involved in Fe transport [Altererythrobacter atlanticus]|uniref:Pesticin receptor n=1 Tax=Croceibacterium atlanticum TaxID=1267766 RepID=A0A0F7KQI3_9SPHN|nr:TonB-dependent receptor [Croceibacterium atlanticum]AKH41402.1 Pesticin receptor precursor [Croceibacterium atlanticum]MBB5732864.1 outer membrane receptor protein involved in Fe transport [Croceibacterium atlanticum]